MSAPINIRKALKSFKYAGMGIFSLFKYENNARIHLIACVLVVIAGVILQISPSEWITIIILIALVWSAEAINTSLEKLADVVSPGFHPGIKDVKDLAAAAVLILAMAAVLVGLIIFVPKILSFCQGA